MVTAYYYSMLQKPTGSPLVYALTQKTHSLTIFHMHEP